MCGYSINEVDQTGYDPIHEKNCTFFEACNLEAGYRCASRLGHSQVWECYTQIWQTLAEIGEPAEG
jgi:hypothetical protein